MATLPQQKEIFFYKNLLLKKTESWSFNILHEKSSSECLPSLCSNKIPVVKISLPSGVIDFPYMYLNPLKTQRTRG
jgi:hypothetical protein